jgi:uncharacterized protein (TIGR02996 family)
VSDPGELLAAIRRADPLDPGPRLVYADWLLDHGDPRGELVRLECQIAAAPDGALLRRREELHQELVAAGVRPAFATTRFGLVESLAIDDADLVAQGDRLFEREPIVGLVVRARGPVAALGDRRWLAHVRRLSVWGDAAAEDVIPLVTSSWLEAIRALSLSNVAGEPLVRAVAEAPSLARLDELSLGSSEVGAAARALASARFAGQLLVLALAYARLTTELDVAALLGSFPRLRTLDLATNGLVDVARAVASMRPALETLRLGRNGIRDDGAEALAACPSFDRLQTLDLKANSIGDRGGLALARSPYLGHLTRLALEENPIEGAAAALVTRFGDRVVLRDR